MGLTLCASVARAFCGSAECAGALEDRSGRISVPGRPLFEGKMYLQDLQLRNYSPKAQEVYVECVALFARHLGKLPELLGPDHICAYQLLLPMRRKAPGSRFNHLALPLPSHPPQGLDHPTDSFSPKGKPASAGPESRGGVPFTPGHSHLKYCVLLTTLYATGLRFVLLFPHFPVEFSPKSIQTFPMNLPNSLTLSRIFAVPLLVVVLLTRVYNPEREVVGLSIYIATLIFLGASVTDYFDGYLARKRQQVTTLGMLLDPVADKLLTSAAFISLVELKWVPAWMVVIIVGREFAISGLRNIASSEGFTIDASELGKIKMAMQVLAITLIILCNKFSWLHPFSKLALWLVVIFALVSAIDYFRKFWKKVDDRVKARQKRKLITLNRRRRNVPTQ